MITDVLGNFLKDPEPNGMSDFLRANSFKVSRTFHSHVT